VTPPAAKFFRTSDELRAWFSTHHASAPELWVGFHKAHTKRAGVDYVAAVEEALCFGWIDTTVRRLDKDRYAHRFTPRRKGSQWSRVNRDRLDQLRAAGRVTEAGERAFAERAPDDRSYSYERRSEELPGPLLARFRADTAAWRYFSEQPPSYRRLAAHWVVSAVRPETREKRLGDLIGASSRATRPRPFLVARSERASLDSGPGKVRNSRSGPNRRPRRRARPGALK
jgi:uncharacterized protein YdeI (YjbR/CyaY-like superfamily)